MDIEVGAPSDVIFGHDTLWIPFVGTQKIRPANDLAHNGGRINKAEVRKRAGYAMGLGLPQFFQCLNDSKEWAIIGGGPSINDQVETIRRLKRRGVKIVSVNKSHDWLLEHGIVPWGHVMLDPMDWVADYVKRPRKDVRYFIASQCHANTFEALKDYPVFMWHAGQDFDDGTTEPGQCLKELWLNSYWMIVPGPTTVGMRAMNLGHLMGADTFHLFGLDSSRRAGKMHAYEKKEAADTTSGVTKLEHKGKIYRFDNNAHMARQHRDFDDLIRDLPEHFAKGRLRREFNLTVYGSGLLPFYAAQLGLHADPECNADPTKVGGFTEEEPGDQSEPDPFAFMNIAANMRMLNPSPSFSLSPAGVSP